MRVVVDANILASYLIEDKSTHHIFSEDNEYLAPHFILSEFAQVLWKYHTKLSSNTIKKYWEHGKEMIDLYYFEEDYFSTAKDIAIKHGHSYYDSSYLAIAKSYDAALLTNDKKMQSIARTMKVKLV
jgi:predicted nucleic acid-binding protein